MQSVNWEGEWVAVALCLPSKAGGPSLAMVGGSRCELSNIVESSDSNNVSLSFSIIHSGQYVSFTLWWNVALQQEPSVFWHTGMSKDTFLQRKAQNTISNFFSINYFGIRRLVTLQFGAFPRPDILRFALCILHFLDFTNLQLFRCNTISCML